MRKHTNKNHCSNCGAPVTTEICPYCKCATGIDTMDADMEYPVIECKEANLNFWNVVFPMIFALMFGFFFIFFPFGIISIIAFIIGITPVIRYYLIDINGQEIEAVVYGYLDDKMLFNNMPGQIVKLLVDTNDGKKFILYQLADTTQPYQVNSKIKLKVYKNLFHIVKDKNIYF